ncbi:MAG: sodium:solute symporter family protein [Eubacteriales bacterium]|jgi:SSS family solute:Na+ symporter
MDILFVIIYLGVLLFNGIRQSYKIKNIKDYSVSTRKYGLFVVFASMSASFIGGGFCSGNAAEVYRRGIGNIVAMFGFSVGQILIGRQIVAKSRLPAGALSPGTIMRQSYGMAGQVTTGICSTMLSIGLLGAQIATIGAMFNVLLHVPFVAGVLIGFAVILVYSTAGGMNAIITAELVEFLLLIVGLPILLMYSMKYVGGSGAIIAHTPESYLNILNEKTPWELISLFLTMMVGEALTPPFIQRMLVGKDRGTISRATILSGVISIPVFMITGTVGLCAYIANSGLEPDLAMSYMVMRALPPGLKGIVITAMLAVVMSSADGCLSSASIGIVSDVISPLSRRRIKPEALLRIARVLNIVVGMSAMLMAILMKNIFKILLLAYSVWSPIVLVPMVSAILGVKGGKRAFVASASGGALSSMIWRYAVGEPFGLSTTTVGFVVSLFLFLVFREAKSEREFTNCLPPVGARNS